MEAQNYVDTDQVKQDLLEHAREWRERAYAPYSDYGIGAALMTEQGIYCGANVEISGRSTSTHAEMLAAFKAATAGATEFEMLAVSTPNAADDGPTEAPCGLCQHTLSQFTDDLWIIEDNGPTQVPSNYSLSDLIGPAYSPLTRHADIVSGDE